MCGIVGVASSWLTNPELDRFKDLLTVSNLRGWQGAGAIISRVRGDEPAVFKTVGTGVDLAHQPEMNQELFHRKGPLPSVCIGHTRWPTKGAVALDTTHPHVHDGIFGVHNGTIDEIMGKAIGKDESDSSILYKAIAEYGAAQVIPTVRGAYALVWIDSKAQTLNFLRNDKRPLHFAVVGANTFYWASEAGMLAFILGRNNVKYELVSLETDTWIEYELPLAGTFKANRIVSTPLKGKAPVLGVTASGPFRLAGGASTGTHGASKTTPTTLPTVVPSTSKPSTVELRIFYNENNGVWQKEKPNEARKSLGWDQIKNRWYLPRMAPTITLAGSQKPRKSFNNKTKEWEDSPTSTTTTSSGGTQSETTTNEKKSSSTSNYVAPLQSSSEELSVEQSRLVTDEDVASHNAATLDQLFQAGPDMHETIPGHFINTHTYMTALKHGCCWCGDPQDEDWRINWVAHDEFICGVCREDDYARNYAAQMYHVDIKSVSEELDAKLNKALAAV